MAYGPTVHPPNGSCTLCIRHYVAMPHMAYSHVHPRLYSLVAIPYGCVYTACITYTYGPTGLRYKIRISRYNGHLSGLNTMSAWPTAMF